MKLANIATVMAGGRLELHLKFNTNEDLLEAYVQITRNELAHDPLKNAAEQFLVAHEEKTLELMDYFADIFKEALRDRANAAKNEESPASVARLEQKIEELESEIRNCYERLSEDGMSLGS
jgi:Na+/phosphate symporter